MKETVRLGTRLHRKAAVLAVAGIALFVPAATAVAHSAQAQGAADVQVEKRLAPDAGEGPYGSFSYTITVTNNGPGVARDVRIEDVTSSKFEVVSADGCERWSKSRLVCGGMGELAVGETKEFTITMKAKEGEMYERSQMRNMVQVLSTSTPDSNNSNNQAWACPPDRVVNALLDD